MSGILVIGHRDKFHRQRLNALFSLQPRNYYMARITVEDCLEKIPNRFQLVLAATYRARMLSQGHTPKIESKNKHGVTALREIAAGEIGKEMLRKVPT